MKIVFLSDLHKMKPDHKVPNGDVLVFCGDICGPDRLESFVWLNDFMKEQPHKHKIAIPGNHDFLAQSDLSLVRSVMPDLHFLLDEELIIDGVKFYGTPWVSCWNWAFSLTEWYELNAKYDLIPDDTDILITHGPPHMILDQVMRGSKHVGSQGLYDKVMQVKPKVHAFGHIHEDYGIKDYNDVMFINASTCDFHYKPVNPPVVVEYENNKVIDCYPSDIDIDQYK